MTHILPDRKASIWAIRPTHYPARWRWRQQVVRGTLFSVRGFRNCFFFLPEPGGAPPGSQTISEGYDPVTTKASARRATRHASGKLNERQKVQARRKRIQNVRQLAILGMLGGGLVLLLLFALLRPQPGEHVASQGNAHIQESQMGQFTYSTYPPTSGPHLGSLAPWGVHTQPIPEELQVHNLEDGGVIVHYNCHDGCPELVAQLTDIVWRYDSAVILEPYPNMDTRIALTAWQRIDRFDDFDQDRIERFIRAYRNRDHHAG